MRVAVRIPAIIVLCFCLLAGAQNIVPLTILDEPLPVLDPGVEIHIPLHAQGGVPPYQWRVSAGELPEGIVLTPEGVLSGRPAKSGLLRVTVTVEDSASPVHTASRELSTQVSAALEFDWLRPPQAHSNTIDGTALVSNSAKDDFDLTVIIVAVNQIGRATALGYQHFTLKAGAVNFQIPFGTTLPRGAYVVHADAVAEIPRKNTILRKQLQTPSWLAVMQGP